MKNGKVLSFTMGCEADPTSRVKVVSDGEIIRVEGLSDEGEPFTIDFELPLEGLRQFQENVKPFLTSSDDVDLENPTNYDWTLKYKADGMEMSTNGIISSANVFKDMKVNILKTLYEVQQKYDYAMKNGAKLKELVDRIEENLTDGTSVAVDERIDELRQLFEPYEEFARVNRSSIANFKYVSAVMPITLVMQDSRELKIPFLRYREYQWLKQEMDELD